MPGPLDICISIINEVCMDPEGARNWFPVDGSATKRLHKMTAKNLQAKVQEDEDPKPFKTNFLNVVRDQMAYLHAIERRAFSHWFFCEANYDSYWTVAHNPATTYLQMVTLSRADNLLDCLAEAEREWQKDIPKIDWEVQTKYWIDSGANGRKRIESSSNQRPKLADSGSFPRPKLTDQGSGSFSRPKLTETGSFPAAIEVHRFQEPETVRGLIEVDKDKEKECA